MLGQWADTRPRVQCVEGANSKSNNQSKTVSGHVVAFQGLRELKAFAEAKFLPYGWVVEIIITLPRQ